MKTIIMLLVLLLSGCAVKVKESYRNKDYKQKLDTISVKWTPLSDHILNIQAQRTSGNSADSTHAPSVSKQQLKDLETRIPKILKNELLKYDVDIVPYDQSKNILLFTPEKVITVLCFNGACNSVVTVQITLKERLSDKFIWFASMKVASPAAPPIADEKDLDTAQEFAETIVAQLNKQDLLPALLATPRISTAPDIASLAEKQVDQKQVDQKRVDQKQIDQKQIDQKQVDQKQVDLLDKTDASYEKLVNWIQEHNKWGASSSFATGFIKEINSALGKKRAMWEIGAGLTKSGKAYRIEWLKNSLNIIEFSQEEAAEKGIEDMKERFTTRDTGFEPKKKTPKKPSNKAERVGLHS